jgi:hypothetical protein
MNTGPGALDDISLVKGKFTFNNWEKLTLNMTCQEFCCLIKKYIPAWVCFTRRN